jgi:hypothetical protein
MSTVEILNFLKKNLGIIIKRLEETGVVILGRDAEGNLRILSVDSEGRLQMIGEFVGAPDASPPSKGVQIHGFDGTYARRIKTTSDGKLLAVLG